MSIVTVNCPICSGTHKYHVNIKKEWVGKSITILLACERDVHENPMNNMFQIRCLVPHDTFLTDQDPISTDDLINLTKVLSRVNGVEDLLKELQCLNKRSIG